MAPASDYSLCATARLGGVCFIGGTNGRGREVTSEGAHHRECPRGHGPRVTAVLTVALCSVVLVAPASRDARADSHRHDGEEASSAEDGARHAVGTFDDPGADHVLPHWRFDPDRHESTTRRIGGHVASASYHFLNDTITDTWSITKSPLSWRWKGWLTLGAVAGTTTALIYYADDPVRQQAIGSPGFRQFGEDIRWMGTGPGLAALTGGFAAAGVLFDRYKEKETARLLLQASATGYLYTITGKLTIGRTRPRINRGPFAFDPFSGEVSMPSGEATSAFIMASVITSQYPAWYVQVLSYSLAGAVSAGRIALDAHWTSDIFLSAALGIAVGKATVYFHRRRLEGRPIRALKKHLPGRHFVQVSTRGFRWTYVF